MAQNICFLSIQTHKKTSNFNLKIVRKQHMSAAYIMYPLSTFIAFCWSNTHTYTYKQIHTRTAKHHRMHYRIRIVMKDNTHDAHA